MKITSIVPSRNHQIPIFFTFYDNFYLRRDLIDYSFFQKKNNPLLYLPK